MSIVWVNGQYTVGTEEAWQDLLARIAEHVYSDLIPERTVPEMAARTRARQARRAEAQRLYINDEGCALPPVPTSTE